MSIVDKLKGMLGQHSDKAKDAVDKAGDVIDERTGGKYSDKVDKAQDKANEFLDKDKPPESGAGS